MRIALALVLTVSLAACGKPSTPAADTAPAPADTAPAPVADAAPAPVADAAPAGSADTAAAPAPDAAPVDAAPVDAAPADAAPAEPPRPATTPEEALQFYYLGTRDKDAGRLWLVMSSSARTALEGVKASALKAPDAELERVGLARATLETMTVEAFFAHMVNATPMPVEGFAKDAPTEVKVEGEGPKRTVRFRLGPAFCEAQVLEEEGQWKVEGSQCEEGG